MTIQNLFSTLPPDANSILENFNEIIQKIKPLNSKQYANLPYAIRDLSHQLTDQRPERRKGYMNDNISLSAYIRYFSWWNLIRLTRLFAGLPAEAFSFLEQGDVILDLGSGPLTVPIALWIARPELRNKKLKCYCVDLSTASMAFGENIFLSVASLLPAINNDDNTFVEPWHIIRIKGSLGTQIRQKVNFITCANMFNELYWDSPKPLEELAKKYTEALLKYNPTSILVVEPGVPRSSRFVSLFRDACIRKKASIVSPCPHIGTCPMDGRKGGKWCHFTFPTDDSPKKLLKLSKDAGIPKDRASLSFVLANFQSKPQNKNNTESSNITLRVISDSIRLPFNKTGRYACSSQGLTLAIETANQKITSGSLIETKKPVSRRIDEKTGAFEIII